MMSTSTSSRLLRRLLAVVAVAAALGGSLAASAAGKHKAADKVKEPAHPSSETGEAPVEMVHISIQTVPARKALVKWGRKNMGMIPAPKPLVLERPRDSGPLDLVIRMTGYLPVHTRAYTFSDSRVLVKLTQPTEKNKLFGYKQEPTPAPDAGTAADPNAASATAAPAPAVPQRLSQ